MIWTRKTVMKPHTFETNEVWEREEEGKRIDYPIHVLMGKKTNLIGLKKDIISGIKKNLEYYKRTRTELYSGDDLEEVGECMVTGIATSETKEVANIYGARYVQTPDTGHVYVRYRPTKSAINNFYLNNITYAATYTNKETAEFRLNSIAVPWRDWMVKTYQSIHGRAPKKVLDVGSGAGHFVEACRRDGMDAHGIELSESSREFARNTWGLELDGSDFLDTTEYLDYDVVTFWGLLEHTPNPKQILAKAYDVLSKKSGMVISKLPRWDSLSSASQRVNPDTIIRHIDPMGHIMLFSDASAAELYVQSNFAPKTAWYYGMDVYETLLQVGNNLGVYDCLTQTGDLQMELQQFIDEARFSDGICLVGVPQDND